MPKAADQMAGKVPTAAPAATAPKQPAPQKAAPPKQTAAPKPAAPAPVKPAAEDFEFQPSVPEIEPSSMTLSPEVAASQLAREKRESLLAAQPAPPSRLRQEVARVVGPAAAPLLATPMGMIAAPQYTAYKALSAAPEMGTYAVDKLASAARSAQEDYGTDLGLTRVAKLAREYLPQSRAAEYQTESPRPGSRAGQSGAERVFVPRGALDPASRLGSVAEFRKFYETEAANLAETRQKLAEKDREIARAPDTATEADMKRLAKERSTLKQLETDYRATLMRSGFNDQEINALVQEAPTR